MVVTAALALVISKRGARGVPDDVGSGNASGSDRLRALVGSGTSSRSQGELTVVKQDALTHEISEGLGRRTVVEMMSDLWFQTQLVQLHLRVLIVLSMGGVLHELIRVGGA